MLGFGMECVRDLYGFTLAGLTDAEQNAREESLARSRSQVNAWLRKMRAKDVYTLYAERRKLKELVRRGLPPEMRPEIWMILSGAKMRKAAAGPGYYEGLCASSGRLDASSGLFDIGSDVQRRFRQHPAFRGREGFAVVRRILGAFLTHNASAGCVPGMLAIVAFLLTVMGFHREEEAFWVLVAMVEDQLFQGVDEQMFFWCKVQEKVLSELVRTKVPKLNQHLEKHGCKAGALGDLWYSSLFVLALPSETVARVWDCLMCEGPKVLHRVALALLKTCDSTISMTTDMLQMSHIVTYKLRRVFNANQLMTNAFKKIGSMKSKQVAAINKCAESVVERELDERAHVLGGWEVGMF